MKLEILGSGCTNCENLEKNTRAAMDRLGLEASVEKVTDYGEIVAYGVMSTPALAIDGEVVSVGRVPSVDEVAELLTAATA